MAAPTLLATLAVLLLIVGVSSHCPWHACQNTGWCNMATFQCSCPHCYIGAHCEYAKAQLPWAPLPCPCYNYGTCKCYWYMPLNEERFACDCKTGFYGERCEHAGPLITTTTPRPIWCDPPCMNGGTCINGVCNCLPMFHGKWCQHYYNGNPCSSYPCLNGGTCHYFWWINKYVYHCHCPPRVPPYLQPNCATPVSYCSPNPCQRGGTCVVDTLPPGYHCECVCFVGGKHCDHTVLGHHLSVPVNACVRNPCKNGGSCCCSNYGYKCTCLPGFTGTNCEVFLVCLPPCQYPCHGGVCNVIGGPTCTPSCRNGGSCVAFNTCLCPCLVTGNNCEHNAVGIPFTRNPCDPNPCPPGQSCCCRGLVAKCTP